MIEVKRLYSTSKAGIKTVIGYQILYKGVEYHKEAHNSLIQRVVRPRKRRSYLIDIPIDLNLEILQAFEEAS